MPSVFEKSQIPGYMEETTRKKQGRRELHDFQNVSHHWNDCSCQRSAQFRRFQPARRISERHLRVPHDGTDSNGAPATAAVTKITFDSAHSLERP